MAPNLQGGVLPNRLYLYFEAHKQCKTSKNTHASFLCVLQVSEQHFEPQSSSKEEFQTVSDLQCTSPSLALEKELAGLNIRVDYCPEGAKAEMRLLRVIKQTDGETAPEAPTEPDAFWL